MIRKNEKGSIMLETVLVLPIFVLIVFFLIQITFVWTARQMTYYAAYCGARAALVYNPQDYHAEKQDDGSWQTNGFIRKGVVHQAACTVLSWISWSIAGYESGLRGNYIMGGADAENYWIGNYQVPLSSNIRNQVAVSVKEFEKIEDPAEDKSKSAGSDKKEEPAAIQEQFPAVTCSVRFRFPLFIPLGGPVIAYFFGANDDVCIPTYTLDYSDNAIGVNGFRAYNGAMVHANLAAHGNYTSVELENDGKLEFYNIVLTENCTMAKPYKTDTFPLIPHDDKDIGL